MVIFNVQSTKEGLIMLAMCISNRIKACRMYIKKCNQWKIENKVWLKKHCLLLGFCFCFTLAYWSLYLCNRPASPSDVALWIKLHPINPLAWLDKDTSQRLLSCPALWEIGAVFTHCRESDSHDSADSLSSWFRLYTAMATVMTTYSLFNALFNAFFLGFFHL